MILIDLNQIVIAKIYSFQKPNPLNISSLVNNGLFPKALSRDVFDLVKSIHGDYGNLYGDVVMCADSSNKSWRSILFPEYKAGRKKDSDESTILMKRFVKNFIHEFWMNYRNGPCYVFKIDGVEADDIIGRLVITNPEERHLIVSRDKDFFQLHSDKVVSLDYTKGRIIRENGRQVLKEHIIRGDEGDGIPNVLSDLNTFTDDKKRQTPLTKKRMANLLKEIPENVMPRYEQNKMLISLYDMPEEIDNKIDGVIKCLR